MAEPKTKAAESTPSTEPTEAAEGNSGGRQTGEKSTPSPAEQALLDRIAALEAKLAQPASPKLDIGPFQLPPGIDEKDVMWRMRGGLDARQAVQAAIQQKNFDDAEAARSTGSGPAPESAKAESQPKPAVKKAAQAK